MVAVSALWMFNAWSVGSWEQMAGNVISAAAALYGMGRLGAASRAPGPAAGG